MPTISTGDLDTHYIDQGQGLPIVLVHASTLDHTSWRTQIEALSTDHRVIAYDLRGHGRTPSQGAYTIATLAEDLHRLIQALELERPIVCGLSMGGMVALTHASRYPDELAGLVLAGTTTPPYLSPVERIQRSWFPRLMTFPARLIGYERLKRGLVWIQRRLYGDAAAGGFSPSDLPPMSTPNFVRSVRAFATFHCIDVDLDAITVPTLVLVGGDEPPVFHAHAERLRTDLQTVTVTTIPDAGHASNLDQPERFNEALTRFATRVDPHGGASSVDATTP